MELNDIWLVNPDRSADELSQKLNISFRKRVARGDRFPLWWALHETFHGEFWLGGICQLFASILQTLTPFILRFLIEFANRAYAAQTRKVPGPIVGHGVGLVIVITFMQAMQSMGTNHFIYRGQMVGGQSRGALMTVIFQKAMKLSGRAKAGGKAIPDESEAGKNEKSVSPPSQPQGFFARWFEKAILPKAGPPPSDGPAGVSGDGSGWSNGRVINLMSTDTYRLDQASGMFHLIWTAPVGIMVTLVLLLINLSYSALAGFGLLVIGTPLLTRTIKKLFRRRRTINKTTDLRVSLTQEILQAVRFVKFFGWESSFLERIDDIRKREIHMIQVLLAIRNAINAVSMSLPIFASMLSFITYSLSQHPLNPAPIFSSLALFNSLRLPLNLLPLVIGQVIDAWASLGRIQEFLQAEEQNEDFEWDSNGVDAVSMHQADFTWERTVTRDAEMNIEPNMAKTKPAKPKEEKTDGSGPTIPSKASDGASSVTEVEPFKLHGMDFSVGRNELIAVIGTVGSGKSSLLAALAGDMRKTAGSVTIGATRAFCPQYAWIQNATVRDNILFGKEFDRKRYEQVIDACALRADLDMLPNSDQTEIGERGITVSGGQKQRLNIARAIYFNSDIVLLDDPLSG